MTDDAAIAVQGIHWPTTAHVIVSSKGQDNAGERTRGLLQQVL